MSSKWMDPTRVKTYISPQGEQTPRGIKILVHKVDGPNKVKNLHKSTKWMDTKKTTYLTKSTKWTDLTKGQYSAHKVDEPSRINY